MSKKDAIRVLTSNGTGEIVEKKSRFIANAFYVESVSAAEDKIAELNKKYYGPDMISDEEIAYEWSKVPHFYYNFYTYAECHLA